ncbi:MAG: hypothetical protein NT029_21925 [Armatimonadetes bacterium]|nr:hypothetical protein [Armatimonadota bacterium]
MKREIDPIVMQRAAIWVPIVAVLLSVLVVYPAWGRYSRLRADVEQKEAQLKAVLSRPVPARRSVVPTADPKPDEPPRFLEEMRAVARASHCTMVGFDLTPKETAKPKTSSEEPAKPDPNKPPEIIRTVRAKVEVEAGYPAVRAFMSTVLSAPRLYAITSVELTRSQLVAGATCRAVVEIERYILDPVALAKVAVAK